MLLLIAVLRTVQYKLYTVALINSTAAKLWLLCTCMYIAYESHFIKLIVLHIHRPNKSSAFVIIRALSCKIHNKLYIKLIINKQPLRLADENKSMFILFIQTPVSIHLLVLAT